MKNVKSFKDHRLILSIGINAGILILLLCLFTPAEKTDDFIMKCILEGAFSGETDAHLLYINYLYGCVLAFLQSRIPGVAWLVVSEYILVFISFIVCTFYILRDNELKSGILLVIPTLLFFGFEAYIKVTFSKTAAIGVTAGLFWLYKYLKDDRGSYLGIIPGFLLAFWGGLYRNKIVIMIVAVYAGIVFYEVVIRCWHERIRPGQFLKKAIRYGFPLIAIFVLINCLDNVGDALFVKDEGWNAYKAYNTYKVELQDYGWPDYDEYAEEYQALGISKNDYNLWNSRDYADEDVFTTGLMKDIISIKQQTEESSYNILGYLKKYPMKFFELNVFWAVLILGLIVLLSDINGKWYIFSFSILIAMLLEFYLYGTGRYAKAHVDVGIFFAIAMFISYFAVNIQFTKNRTVLITAIIILAAVFSINRDYEYMTTDTYTGDDYTISREAAHEAMDTITADKDHLYVLSNDEYYGLMRGYGAFETITSGQLSNVFILSSFKYPSHNVVLERYGKDNIFQDLCDHDVYYVTSEGSGNADEIKRYLREHYYPHANYYLYKSLDGVNIYRFTRY